jgi:hypothetical protein
VIIRQPKAGDDQFDSGVLLEGPEDGVAATTTDKYWLPTESTLEGLSRRYAQNL